MKVLQQFFGGLIQFITLDDNATIQARNEAYLAESTDLHDLEYRLRQIDRNAH